MTECIRANKVKKDITGQATRMMIGDKPGVFNHKMMEV